MADPAWDLFVALVFALVVGVVGLARTTATLLHRDEPLADAGTPEMDPSSPSLLLNLGFSHAGIVLVLGAIVWLTGVPRTHLGLVGIPDLVSALLLGVALYAVDEGFVAVANAVGWDAPEGYRELLAPDSPASWALLLGFVLPAVAVAEELLFRGALIGGVGAGTGVSPWALAVVSSVAFGSAHAAQERMGMVVTASLGFVLAAVFVATGDLLLVIVAHYLVNALEFVVHEGLGFEWTD